MTTGTGLDAQVVVGQESAYGTAATPDHAYEFNKETVKWTPTYLEPAGLRHGTKYKRASRSRIARIDVAGDLDVDFATLGMGLLVRNMLGSVTNSVTAVSGSATQQVHQPGDFRGLGMTIQVGRPEAVDGVVEPFTYTGCKVSQWVFTVKDNGTPNLVLSVNGQNENTGTALVTPSYPVGETVFAFSQADLKIGGTVASSGGVLSVSGNTSVASSTVVSDFALTGKAPMDTTRYGLGNQGLKSEPLENAIPTITGKSTAEFNDSQFYPLYKSFASTPIVFTLTGDAIPGTGQNNLVEIIMPSCKVKANNPNVSGPGIVSAELDFEVYSDESHPVIQVRIVSADTTV